MALINLQYLRAIAAMMVVWVHAREQFEWIKIQFPSEGGNNGVDLFFVISGFIMVYTTHNKTVSPLSFLMRRFTRVAPLYWSATLLIVAVALAAPSILKSTTISFPHVLASFAFWPMPSPKFPDSMWPLLIPGWTLNYEMAFYVLFGMSLWAPKKWRLTLLCTGMALLAGAGAINNFTGALKFYTDAIILTFVIGTLLGQLYCTGRLPQNKIIGWTLIFSGIAIWWITQSIHMGHRLFGAGIPASLVLSGACILPGIRINGLNWLSQLGDASYSIYLSHIFVLATLRFAWLKTGIENTSETIGYLFILSSIVASSFTGLFIFHKIENKLSTITSIK